MLPALSSHSLCRVAFATVAMLFALAAPAAAQSVTIGWDANTESDLAGYRVEYGTVAGSPSTTVDVGNVTQRQFNGLQAGVTYYFRVVAYNTTGLVSPPSSEISHTPPVAPQPPVLTGVSPASGSTSGGTTITLTGSNFITGATVSVGGVAATSVTVVSGSTITARTPAGTAGARDVRVTTSAGAATLTGGYTYTAAAPTLTGVSPSSGPTSGGTSITIAGSNFAAGATVTIGGVAATNVVVVSATSITARTPAGTAGARDVRVTTSSAATMANGFTYVAPAPTLTGVSPSSGPVGGGTDVTLTGTNFVAGATVTVGGAAATNVVVLSATSLSARVPAGTAGARDVRVTTTGGAATLAGGFTYVPSGTDSDGDGLSNDFETRFGLNPSSAAGNDGAAGDPDADGVTNLDEQARGTHPRGTHKRYLAEGAMNGFFHTRFALANPQAVAARVLLSFTDSNGATTRQFVSVAARSRATVDTSTIPALDGASFATALEADQVVVLDRLMSWAGALGYGAHMETAVERPSTTWFLAEGATHGSFDLFYLVQNPSAAAASLTVRYLRPSGAPITKYYTVPAGSRFTIWVDQEDPALAASDVSAEFTSTNGVPVIVERSMYLNTTATAFKGGHNSAGVTAPSTSWFLAEGATGKFFTMFVLLANPNASAASVRITYLRQSGSPVVKTYSVPANSRRTLNVALEHGSLSSTSVSAKVESTNGVPIIVERTMWWPGALSGWTEGHNAFGASRTAPKWVVAEGEQGGPKGLSTFILIANTSAAAANVRVTMLLEAGAEVSRTYTVGGNTRYTVPAADFAGADGRRVSFVVESLNPATAGALVVERATYWNVGNEQWGAGSNSVAAIVP